MCGISGFITLANCIKDVETVYSMNNLIKHRGPDDEGYLIFKDFHNSEPLTLSGDDTIDIIWNHDIDYSPKYNKSEFENQKIQFAFGHRRLSIQDVSSYGHQPMSYNENKLWITYNGEVYNFESIKNELLQLGYKFISKSDTEVILAAYMEWGIDCFNKFNGMWALAIYDINNKKIVLSRDRFGVKPLYYYLDKDVIYFASEIKQFTSINNWDSLINPERVFDFLKWGMSDHTNETMFKKVLQLSPGNNLIIDLNLLSNKSDINECIKINKWYELKSNKIHLENTDFNTEFKKLFYNSVKLRMVSDVPVGSCLSGGLDSSAIVCQMTEILNTEKETGSKVNTFSACSNVEKYDERKWIESVLAKTKSNSTYIFPDINDLIEELNTLTWIQDEPFGSTSIFAQSCVFRSASINKIKVILDGQGGDEVLCGYMSFFPTLLIDYLKNIKIKSFLREVKYLKLFYNYTPDYIRIIGALFPVQIQNIIRKILRKKSTLNFINIQKLGINSNYSGYYSFGNELYNLKAASINQISLSPVPRLLHWEDRNSMSHSVESRVPFLDYKLVEFCIGLPNEYKINQGVTKSILRKSLIDILPQNIIDRMSKLGFETPEEVWIRENPEVFRNMINDSIKYSNGIINESALILFDNIINGKEKFSFQLWRIISFGRWMKIYNVRTENN